MPTETLAVAKSAPPAPEPRHRYRLRFAKAGDLRLVSHHDLMHVLERMMRRAEIPFAVTQGFHPQPKMSFALSLALGVIGRNEVFDVELTRDLEPEELLARLNGAAPAGLTFSSAARLEKKPSSQVRRMFYRLAFPDEERVFDPSHPLQGDANLPEPGDGSEPRPTIPSADDVAARIAAFLSSSECWITRIRPQRRQLNIRPFVDSLTHDSTSLSLILWVTPVGAARPEEIVGALGLGHLFDAGAVLERTHLELLGELPEHDRFVPDLANASIAGAMSAPASETPNDAPSEEPRRAPSHTALMDNPLSFDS